MDPGHHTDLAKALRARLAAAGLEPPSGDDARRLERDLALHLERIAEVEAAAGLGPTDPPLTDPTGGAGAVDNRRPAPGGSVTLPEGAPIAAGEGEARPGEVRVRPGEGAARPGEVQSRPAGGLGEQARLVREGEATSVELVEQALERRSGMRSGGGGGSSGRCMGCRWRSRT